MSNAWKKMTWMLGVTALVWGTGCPKPYPNCETDEACKAQGEVCVQGQCRECATDDQCKAGFTCDPTSFRCVPKPAAEAKETGSTVPDSCDADTDCPQGMACQAGKCVSAPTCDWSAVRFGFNESSLNSESQSRLKAIAECIRSEKAKVTLEGHADERGTEEYNLQLSNRRASTVKRYLVDLGVASSSLETVGYGEERPVASGQNEADWAANRRVEFNKR